MTLRYKIDEIDRLVHPRDGHSKIVTMLVAYLDESGVHGDADVCVVAGYFGGVNQWRQFERQWKSILVKFDISGFHAHRFWAKSHGRSVGEYIGWDKARRDRLIRELTSAITSRRIYPVAGAVDVKEWRSLTDDQRKWLSGAVTQGETFLDPGARKKPYFLPFQSCIVNSVRYCKPGVRIHYVCDLNKNLCGYGLDLFQKYKTLSAKWGPSLGDIAFSSDADAVHLQAADLLAYQTYQYCKSRVLKPRSPVPTLLAQLLKNSRDVHDHHLFDRHGMEISLPPHLKTAASGKIA